jgi:hypothetical protein
VLNELFERRAAPVLIDEQIMRARETLKAGGEAIQEALGGWTEPGRLLRHRQDDRQ